MAIVTLDLRADAIAEVDRVANARRFHRDGDEGVLAPGDGGGPLVTRARRSGLRRMLGRRILAIWRVRCEDAGGRTVESGLVALLIEVVAMPSKAQHRDWVRALLRNVDEPVVRHVNSALAQRCEAAAIIAGRFASARIAREAAIAARLSGRSTPIFQSGLFDRREERARRDVASESSELDLQARERLAAALETTATTARLGELLLVLTP